MLEFARSCAWLVLDDATLMESPGWNKRLCPILLITQNPELLRMLTFTETVWLDTLTYLTVNEVVVPIGNYYVP